MVPVSFVNIAIRVNMQDQNQFKVGDTVYCFLYGEGKVITLHGDSTYLEVQFKNATGTYTIDGRLTKERPRTLFFTPIEIPESALIRPKKVLYKAGAILKFKTGHTEYIRELAQDFIEGDKVYTVKSEFIKSPSFDIDVKEIEVIRE